MNEFGICEKCQVDNCLKCKFSDDYSKQECLECDTRYSYLSSDKTCKPCNKKYIPHGSCRVCSDNLADLNSATCSCDIGYFLNDNKTCSFYSEDCKYFILDNNNRPYCFKCESERVLYKGKCLNCPSDCSVCSANDDGQTICTSCNIGYTLLNEKCEYCGYGCTKCIIDEFKNKICLSCQYNYALSPNNTCIPCLNSDYLGKGCRACRYNKTINKYECLLCSSHYYASGIYISDYAYIINEFQCLRNTESKQIYLYGCQKAYHIQDDKYECSECRNDFSQIINDNTCRKLTEIKLSNNCLEVLNIGNETNPIYSCNKCNNETALITNINNINDCYERSDYLSYCLKGSIDINDNILCDECVSFALLKNSNEKRICECNYDSFGIKNKFCYKCDDENKGNPGCIADEGCEYRPANDQLNCNKCKPDYFEFNKGQCFSCSTEMEFCNKCHLDENSQFVCDSCDENFVYNKIEKKCELICKEYPDISPGCIICNEEYKLRRKCQSCELGYFKAEDDKCVWCRAEKNGGPACNKCMKDQTNGNIICKKCEGGDRALNSKGKCNFIPEELKKDCYLVLYKKVENNEKMVCVLSNVGYYLNSYGNCVDYTQYFNITENCRKNIYYIENFKFEYTHYKHLDIYYKVSVNDSLKKIYYNDIINDKLLLESFNDNLRKINSTIYGDCEGCVDGFYLNWEKKCVPLKIDNCSLISMLENYNYKCEDFCKKNNYPLVIVKLDKNNESSYTTIKQFIYKIENRGLLIEHNSLLNLSLCIDNSENSIYSNLENCVFVEYLGKQNKYVCRLCKYKDYYLDDETGECIKYDDQTNCQLENIGSKTNPIFSCKKCKSIINKCFYDIYKEYYENGLPPFDNSSDYLLVKEGIINFCVYKKLIPENCLSVTIDTTYAINKYNCTSCSINYLPYYSEFYGRYICQNIFNEIKKSKVINLEKYKSYDKIDAINGLCPNNTYFTPDGKYCYKCNKDIHGCKSQCSFSLERNNAIKCLDGCIDGFIETSEGECQPCYNINRGCLKCHYDEYPIDYSGIKRREDLYVKIVKKNITSIKIINVLTAWI